MVAFSFDLPCGMCVIEVARMLATHFNGEKANETPATVTKYGDKIYLGDELKGLYLRHAGTRASICGELGRKEFEQAMRFLKKHAPPQPKKKTR